MPHCLTVSTRPQNLSSDPDSSRIFPVTTISAPAVIAALAVLLLCIPPPTINITFEVSYTAFIIEGGTGWLAPDPASRYMYLIPKY